MKQIYCVRHGESMNNTILDLPKDQYDQSRDIDPGLSQKGIKQCELGASYFIDLNIKIDKILCSPFRRAIESALIISKIIQAPIKIVQNVYEMSGNHKQGIGHQGKTRQEFEKLYPGIEIDDRIQDKGWYFKESKETKEESQQRAKDMLQELPQEQGNTFILITHGNMCNLFLNTLIGNESDYYFYHQNAGITLVTYQEQKGYIIEYYNNYTHLQKYNLQTGEAIYSQFRDKQLT